MQYNSINIVGNKEKLIKNLENIPEELKKLDRWVCWRYGELQANGKPQKIPVYCAGDGQSKAKPNDPSTWVTFQEAVEFFKSNDELAGIWLSLPEREYIAIDIDDCLVDGQLSDLAKQIINNVNSYCEFSPSKTGIRIICKGFLPYSGNKNSELKLEFYDGTKARFISFTGNLYGPKMGIVAQDSAIGFFRRFIAEPKTPSNRITGPLEALERETAPTGLTIPEALEMAFNASNGDKIKSLWEGDLTEYSSDHSVADLALSSHLWFYLGSVELVEAAFRQSALYRKKYERDDYREGMAVIYSQGPTYQKSTYDPNKIAAEYSAAIKPVETSEIVKTENLEDEKIFDTWEEIKLIADNQKEDWVIPNWLEFGSMALLCGLPFSGKSCIVSDLIASVCNGKQFAGHYLPKCPILILDLENKERILTRRIEASLGGDEGTIKKSVTRINLEYAKKNLPFTAEKLAHVLEKWGQERGIIIYDTLRSTLPGKATNDEEIAEFLYPLQQIAKRKNMALIVLHHDKKAGGYSGSTAIAGSADYLWQWSSNYKSKQGVLELAGTRGDHSDSLEFKFENGRNIFLGKSGDVALIKRTKETEAEMEELLSFCPVDWASFTTVREELEKQLQLGDKQVRRLLNKAVDMDLLEERGTTVNKEIKIKSTH